MMGSLRIPARRGGLIVGRQCLIIVLICLSSILDNASCFVSHTAMLRPLLRDASETFCQQKDNEFYCWTFQRVRMTSTSLRNLVDQEIEHPMKINGDAHSYMKSLHEDDDDEIDSPSGLSHASTIDLNDDSNSLLDGNEELANLDVPLPTAAGGYTHTKASRAKIGAANKGKTPWNKGRQRSAEDRARIAAGVRARNREKFLQKLQDMGMTEEEYEAQKKEERRKKEAERRARKTENGGYRPTEETRAKISKILKEKHARGEIKRSPVDPSKVRRGFTHSEETRQKISESLRKRWSKDHEYRDSMTSKMKKAYSKDEVRKKVSDTLKKKWKDPEFREEMLSKMKKNRKAPESTEEYKQKISEAMKKKWQDPEYRAKTLGGIANRVDRPAKRRKPSKPRGSSDPTEVRMMKPLEPGEAVPTARKLKKKKKKAAITWDSADAQVEVAKTKKKKKAAAKKKKLKKEPDGSVNRLREERPELFKLLYGDDKPASGESNIEKKPVVNDDSLDDDTGNSEGLLDRLSSRSDFDDEDLDTFDPYGLDDY